MIKITYMSDLHLEFWDKAADRFITEVVDHTPQSDLIVLAGDIGVLKTTYEPILKLLRLLSEKGRKVVYVPGNHCFYKDSYSAGKARLYKMHYEVPQNVIVCHEAFHSFKFDEYTICAGAVWFPDLHAPAHEKWGLNDFNQIPGLEPAIYKENDLFVQELKFVCQETKDPVIVATHHSPSYRSVHPKYAGDRMNQFFCNNLDDFIETYEPSIWVHGHLHDSVDYKIGGTRIVSNAAGYVHEMPRDWFPKTVIIDRDKDENA
jgi:UDP-2,3-diacylglucosamine pyrophosphatase LpxH